MLQMHACGSLRGVHTMNVIDATPSYHLWLGRPSREHSLSYLRNLKSLSTPIILDVPRSIRGSTLLYSFLILEVNYLSYFLFRNWMTLFWPPLHSPNPPLLYTYAISSSNEIREFQLFAQFHVGSHIYPLRNLLIPKSSRNKSRIAIEVVTPNSSIKVAVVRPPERRGRIRKSQTSFQAAIFERYLLSGVG